VTGPRRRLPDERPAITHHFSVGGLDGYFTVGLYPDGAPGELFISISKEGSTLRGFTDAIGVLFSLSLQYGVPLEDILKKLRHMRFEPAGPAVGHVEIRTASSILDYLAQWLSIRFLPEEARARVEV